MYLIAVHALKLFLVTQQLQSKYIRSQILVQYFVESQAYRNGPICNTRTSGDLSKFPPIPYIILSNISNGLLFFACLWWHGVILQTAIGASQSKCCSVVSVIYSTFACSWLTQTMLFTTSGKFFPLGTPPSFLLPE